jgi:hypothetical protein
MSLGVLLLADSAESTTTTPSLATVRADVAASVKLSSINPMTSVPPLAQLTSADEGVKNLAGQCYNVDASFTVPTDAASTCQFGSPVAKRTVLLIGDSQSGMWSPTLDLYGHRMGWKVVILAKPACGSWGNPNTAITIIYKSMTVAQCNTFNGNVAAWAVANKPAVIVIVSRGYPIGKNQDVAPSLATLEREMNAEISRLVPSKARIVVISPIPRLTPFNSTYPSPSACESIPVFFSRCQIAFSKAIPSAEIAAEKYELALHRIRLVDITPLFCTSLKCTIVTKDASGLHLMYWDADHIQRYFGTWIEPAFASILQPQMPV